jgi:hypothetical protein
MSEGKQRDATCCSRMVTGGLALGVALFLAAVIAVHFQTVAAANGYWR